MPDGPHGEASLVLGWRLRDDEDPFEPLYWTDGTPVLGKHSSDHLVETAPKGIAYHTVIVAQSGSGKSFFLGRLIEEIALKTRSRVIILDPNSDFRKIWSTVDSSLWERAGYDKGKRSGFLPDETSKDEFESRWARIKKGVYTRNEEEEIYFKQMELDWTKIPIEILGEGLGPNLQTEIRHCHDAVCIIDDLLSLTKSHLWHQGNNHDLLEISKKIFFETRGKNEKQTARHIKQVIPFDFSYFKSALENYRHVTVVGPVIRRLLSAITPDDESERLKAIIEEAYQRASGYRSFVLADAEQIYFSMAFSVRQSGLLQQSPQPDLSDERIQVFDLPSIDQVKFKLLAVSALLEREWAQARGNWEKALRGKPDDDKRVPTFIVLDEAHNLMPSDANNDSERFLVDQFRRIAAEGRKFGIFLILVSQRPDKLNSFVISECENRAVMKLGAQEVLQTAERALSLSEVSQQMRDGCLQFDLGRALIVGPWAGGIPKLLYGAARRTEEGGRNLRAEYWGQAEPEHHAAPTGSHGATPGITGEGAGSIAVSEQGTIPTDGSKLGTVKWYNPAKGYGFIIPRDGGADVFFHSSAVEKAGLTTLKEDQEVEFEVVSDRGKYMAENLRLK